MALDVKFKQGNYASLPNSLEVDTLYFAKDQAVMGAAGKLYYGQPTITYANNKVTLWGYKGASAETAILGEIDLTLDSFLEKAKYFDKDTTMAAIANWVDVESIDEADVLAAYKEAFGVTGDLPAEHSAIVMVMHGESSEGDTHSLVVIPVGKLMGDVQTEVDQIEESVGLNGDGTYTPITSGVAQGARSVKAAVEAINTNLGVKAEDSTLDAGTVWAAIEEVAAEKTAVVADENNLNITVESADTEGKVTYTVGESGLTPDANGVVISAATTVAANLGALDTKIGAFSASPEYASAFTAASINAIATDDTVAAGLSKLDNKVKALVDEVLDNEGTTANAIEALAIASGVKDGDGNIAYQIHSTDSILKNSTSLDSADVALADAIRELQATAGALKGKDAIVVDKESETSDALQVSLKLNTANTTDVTESTGGIKLTNTEDGLGATLYWGSF